MFDLIQLMWKPFLACLILTGIHAYLGIHVVERKVIFVDLALAQIAALGATTAFLFGFDLHGQATYWFSLAATTLGAFVFSMSRSRIEKIPQEAIIGIAYAVSTALSVLILSRTAEGDEHLRYMLVGDILLVDGAHIFKMGVLYSIIGLVHWVCRKKFILISTDPERAYAQGISVRFWDLIFYFTFGFVVTSSVEVAGVLLVFSFLIVPAVSAILFCQDLRSRLFMGWATGFLASLVGIVVSYHLDFPTGATIVCTFGFLLIFLGLIKRLAVRICRGA